MDKLPVYSYPDDVARKWKAERDRYLEALEDVVGSLNQCRRIQCTSCLDAIERAKKALS